MWVFLEGPSHHFPSHLGCIVALLGRHIIDREHPAVELVVVAEIVMF